MKSMEPGNRLTITQTIADNEVDSSQSYPVIVAVIVHRKGKKPRENDHNRPVLSGILEKHETDI